MFCRHLCHRGLSLWQPPVPPATTKLVSWRLAVFSGFICIFWYCFMGVGVMNWTPSLEGLAEYVWLDHFETSWYFTNISISSLKLSRYQFRLPDPWGSFQQFRLLYVLILYFLATWIVVITKELCEINSRFTDTLNCKCPSSGFHSRIDGTTKQYVLFEQFSIIHLVK